MLEAWKWSLTLLVRSAVRLLGLAILAALWGLAGYQWLGLPKSSALVLLLSLLWAILQILVALSILAGTAASAAEAAGFGSLPSAGLTVATLNRKLLTPTALAAIGAAFLFLAMVDLFGWFDAHSVEFASFLTFHSQRPASHILIEKIFRVIESLLYVAVSGFLLSFLVILLRAGWRDAWRQGARTLANCFWRSSFLTSLLSVAVFGGLSYLLALWHPKVSRGSWDYAQMILRLGGALVLLVVGWFFWLLSLARLGLQLDTK